MTSLVLRRARVIGDGRLVDIAVEGGRVAAVDRALEFPARIEAIDLDGRWVMPGLWDAHAHFTQWARQSGRIDLSGATSAADAVARLRAAAGSADSSAPVVGRGFQDALWPDALTAEALEWGGRPVLAVSHDLHCVWLNDAAAAVLGAPHPGVLREADAFAAEIALDTVTGDVEPLVADAAAAASARGLVGIRDFEFSDNVESWRRRVGAGLGLLRVRACIYEEHLAASDARGLASGDEVPGTGGLVTVDGLKIFTDGSLNTRTALTHDPYGAAGAARGERSVGQAAHSPQDLRELFATAAQRGLSVAAHAIGDAAVTMALDAFAATRAKGTIEHAQLVTASDLPRFARLGIAASVQPQHAIDDRDVADAVWADRSDRAFAYRSLADAGVRLMLGSDAPVAPLDPWVAIAAAVRRSDDDRAPWHPEQHLTREEALAASVGGGYREGWVVPGMAADLIAIDHDPLAATAQTLRAMPVALTLLAGRVTYSNVS